MELWVTWGSRGWAWTPFLLLQELPSPSDKEETDVINGQGGRLEIPSPRGSLLWKLPSGRGRVLSTGAKRAGQRAKKPGPRKAECGRPEGQLEDAERAKEHEEESKPSCPTQGREDKPEARLGQMESQPDAQSRQRGGSSTQLLGADSLSSLRRVSWTDRGRMARLEEGGPEYRWEGLQPGSCGPSRSGRRLRARSQNTDKSELILPAASHSEGAFQMVMSQNRRIKYTR